MAKTIWHDVGEKADVGAAGKNFSPESRECKDNPTKNVEDIPTKKRKIEDNALACLSSNEEEEDKSREKDDEDKETDKPIVPSTKAIKKRIPLMTPKVADKVDMPTVATSKRSLDTEMEVIKRSRKK